MRYVKFGIFVFPLIFLFLAFLVLGGIAAQFGSQSSLAGACGAPAGATTNVTVDQLDTEQMNNAATIIDVGRKRSITDRGFVVAIATALQESTLRNLPGGDGTSVGLFQQIDTWGSFEQRHDPVWAADHFYEAMLKYAPNYADPSQPITVSAQNTQRSAFPSAYAKWETTARQIVEKVSGNITPVNGEINPCLAPISYNGPAGAYVSPVDAFTFTSKFGRRGSTMHQGVDLAAPIGTPVRAITSGVVVKALQQEDSGGGGTGLANYGRAITIDNGNGIVSLYAHNDTVLVTPGQQVVPGQQIATLGNTGRSSGPHLHFEIRKDGNQIDPEPYMQERGINLRLIGR